jgi:hypothetical protein
MTEMPREKRCSTCHRTQPVTNYSKQSRNKDGLRFCCKSCVSAAYFRDKDKILPKIAEYRKNNQHVRRAYIERNRTRLTEVYRDYVRRNREKVTTRKRLYNKKKRLEPLELCKHRIQNLIRASLNRRQYKKTSRTQQIVGCSYAELLAHLQSTWDNNYPNQLLKWEEVHIDHVVPLASVKTEEDIIKLNHYSNLQLLTAADNLAKSDSLGA